MSQNFNGILIYGCCSVLCNLAGSSNGALFLGFLSPTYCHLRIFFKGSKHRGSRGPIAFVRNFVKNCVKLYTNYQNYKASPHKSLLLGAEFQLLLGKIQWFSFRPHLENVDINLGLRFWCQNSQGSLLTIPKHDEISKRYGCNMPINPSGKELDLI